MEKREKRMLEWGMDPVPDELLPPVGTLGFRIKRYGMNTWGDLFNSRQNLALITFVGRVRKANNKMLESGMGEGYVKAVVSYISIILSRHSSYNSSLSWWETTGERTFNTFGRQALPMVFDFSEQNPYGISTGNLSSQIEINHVILEQLSSASVGNKGIIDQQSANNIKFKDNYFDAIFTDPPYYDNVPYSYLSDFFYVWLKRLLNQIYPELFSTPSSSKCFSQIT